MPYLFAYGTLKEEEALHPWLIRKEPIEKRTLFAFDLYQSKWGDYPIAVNRYDGRGLKGEIYNLTDKELKRIEIMEIAGGYRQRTVGIGLRDRNINLIIFVMSRVDAEANGTRISTNDWKGGVWPSKT